MLKYLRQLASESLIYGLAGTLTRFITIFLVPLYTRALTPEDYGVMSLVRNTTTLVAVFASLSLDSAAQRFYWDTENVSDRKSALACWTWSWLVLAGLGTIVMVILSDRLALRIVGMSDASTSIKLAAYSVPLSVLGVVYMNRLRMQRRPWAVTIYALITALATIVLAAVFILILKWGVKGVFAAQLAVALGTTLFLIPLLGDWIHPRHLDLKRWKAMLRYSIPLIPAVIAFWVIDVIDRYFLQAYATTSQIGIYEIGYSIAAAVALGTGAFQQAWIPFALSIEDVVGARDIYAHTLLAYAWVGGLACAGATLFAPEALRLLTTKAYYGASTVVMYLAFSYFLMGVGYIATLGAAVKKQTISVGIAVMAGAALNIVLNFWLVPKYGIDGAALATVVSYLVIPVYLFYRSQLIYPIPYRFGRFVVIVVFSILISRFGGSWSFQSIWVGVFAKLAALSLFLPLLLVLRIVTASHIRKVFGRKITGPLSASKSLQVG